MRQSFYALTVAVLVHLALGWLLLDRDRNAPTSIGHSVTVALASSGRWSPSIVDPVRPDLEPAREPTPALSPAGSQVPPLQARRVEADSSTASILKPVPEQASRRQDRRTTAAQGASKQALAGARQRFSGATHEVDKMPVPLAGNPRPGYPLDARRRGLEGRVHVEVVVSERGTVTRATIKRSSGYRSLDQAALQAVRRWQFRPAERGGKAAALLVEVPIVFRLRSPSFSHVN